MTETTASAGRFRWIALGVFAIAFGVRLVHILQIRRAPFFTLLLGDSRSYDEWAVRIAGGDWIGTEVFYQAPLYPYFLGVVYRIVGRDLLVVRILQAAIGSASCVLLAYGVRRMVSDAAGAVAGLLLALWAPAIFFDGLLQKSVLDVFFVCVLVWLIATTEIDATTKTRRHEHTGIPGWLGAVVPSWIPFDLPWLALGLTLGALALTRENAIVLVAVVLGWVLMHPDRWRRALLVTAGLAVMLVPVAVRNRAVGGGFYVTTSQLGPNFYIGNNPRADGTYASLRYGRGAPEYERQDATELAEHALGRTLTPAEVSRYWTGRALDFIAGDPAAWLRLTGRKAALLWNRIETVDTESQESHAEWSWPLRLLGPLTHFGMLVPLALFGALLARPSRSPLGAILSLALAYAASVVLFYVFARYRYPLVPLLIVFASIAIARLAASPRAALAIGWPGIAGVAAAAVFANWPLLSPALMQAVTESNVGVALQEARRYDEAIGHYRRAIALRPQYPPAYNNLGTALRAAGRLDEAVDTYHLALALEPDFPDAEYNLANALVERERFEEAILHYRTALGSVPGSVEVHTNLGIALAARGHADEALKEFQAAIVADPRSARAHRNLGDLLAARGEVADGVAHLRRATELDPSDAAAHYDLGVALLDAGAAAEAAAALRQAVRLQPAFAAAHNNLGIALGSEGRLDDAIAEFREALRLDPGLGDAQRNLATALRARQALTSGTSRSPR